MTQAKILHELKNAGSRFAFELFLEIWYDQIIAGLRKWLSKYKVAAFRRMVQKGKFPPISASAFAQLTDYADHLNKISVHRLMEAVAEARPDIAAAILELGMPGAEYMVKLRSHLLERISTPEKALTGEAKPSEDLVKAVCDECGKSWPVPREEFDKIEECPFCRHPSK